MSTDSGHDTTGSAQADSWLAIKIFVRSNHPELLRGLEQLLQLNLISQQQVKKLCRKHLSCVLPARKVDESPPVVAEPIIKPQESKIPATSGTANETPPILAGVLQSFLDELSIRWLLLIGIFLVVVSSGVLAASQWERFPLYMQYLVLLIYTFGFWGMGWWTGKQEGLRLTSQTLNQIATLLIPINFWAINYLGLGNNLIEWSIILVAILSLSLSIFLLSQVFRNTKFISVFLYLSYIHLIWHVPWLSLVGTYAGIIIILILKHDWIKLQAKYPPFSFLLLLGTWSLLLVRVLLTRLEQLPNYSLAISLMAWLLATLYLIPPSRENLDEQPSESIPFHRLLHQLLNLVSPILFVMAWWISLVKGITTSDASQYLYWTQNIGISLLAIHLFYQRLLCHWRKQDLTAIFIIGLQAWYTSKELIPLSWRLQIDNFAQAITQTSYFPESFWGITLFPYVILWVLVASWLYRRQKPQLAIYSEYLTLCWGIILTCLSFANPTWRSLNLLLSTLTLLWVARIRYPFRNSLVYLAHLLGIVTLISSISLVVPNLTQLWLGVVLIGLAMLEWSIYLPLARRKSEANFTVCFRQSCWYFGLALSGMSYVCFANYIYSREYLTAATVQVNSFYWGLIWLMVPGMLTLIAKSSRSLQRRRLTTNISCITLVAAQLLTIGGSEARIITFAFASGLMFANVFNYRRLITVLTHLGFVIGFFASLFLAVVPPESLEIGHCLLFASVMIISLYRLRAYLLERLNTPKFNYISQRNAQGILGVGFETTNFKLINKYLTAIDYWAIALMIIAIGMMSLIYGRLGDFNVTFEYLLTAVTLGGAIFWRYQQQPNNYTAFTLAWLGELGLVGLLSAWGGSGFVFATANIMLGLVTLGFVSSLKEKTSWAELDLAYIPLLYAGCAIFWRLGSINAYTGLIVLATAFILLNTQLSNSPLQKLTNYGGVVSLSLGIYELVGYRVLVAATFNYSDRLTILAFVTIAIALSYRLAAYFITFSPEASAKTLFNLHHRQVILIAHLHWAVGSTLKIMAAGIAIEGSATDLTIISIATSCCIAGYALIQGRDHQEDEQQDWWVYVGLVELMATLVYSRLLFSKLSLLDPWRVIFTCAVALIIYQIPWQNLGWRITPWRRTALILPAMMALVTLEDISLISLAVTALFYLRIAYAQSQIRWSYVSLWCVNWLIIRLVWQYQGDFFWTAGIISLSILYLAQVDPVFQLRRQARHYLRLLGSSILCLAALLYQPLITPGIVSFSLIFLGLGLRIRAFLFTGTITLILTALHQLMILVLTYSFLKWVVGLLAGIGSIAIAAGFERYRKRVVKRLDNYRSNLQHWQ